MNRNSRYQKSNNESEMDSGSGRDSRSGKKLELGQKNLKAGGFTQK